MRLYLTLGTQAPKNYFRLLNNEPTIGGRLQTGGGADRAVYVGSQPAMAADKVMVVISHSRLVAGRVTGGLDASEEARFFHEAQIVIHGLSGESAEPLAGGVRNGFRIPMLSFAQNRQKDGKTGRRHAQTDLAKGFMKCGFIRRHTNYYTLLIWNESTV